MATYSYNVRSVTNDKENITATPTVRLLLAL